MVSTTFNSRASTYINLVLLLSMVLSCTLCSKDNDKTLGYCLKGIKKIKEDFHNKVYQKMDPTERDVARLILNSYYVINKCPIDEMILENTKACKKGLQKAKNFILDHEYTRKYI